MLEWFEELSEFDPKCVGLFWEIGLIVDTLANRPIGCTHYQAIGRVGSGIVQKILIRETTCQIGHLSEVIGHFDPSSSVVMHCLKPFEETQYDTMNHYW